MITTKGSLTGNVNAKQSLTGTVNKAIEYIAPSTQSKEVTPTKELQTVLPDEGIFALSRVKVQPIPNEYIMPDGEIELNANGVYDVTEKASANVQIPLPSGTKEINITQNGTITEDITDYENAEINVNIPGPTGTKQISITQNGTTTEDVTNYANAEITANIPMRAPKVEGTFTLATDVAPPVITHNLGTEKIAVLIYPYSSVAAHAGYRDYSLAFINTVAFCDGDTWTIDLTPYNSTRFPEPVDVEIGSRTDYPRTANGQASPWTTQSSITAGTFYGDTPSGHQVTTTTYKHTATWASGTYKYHIWALN